MPRQYSTSHDVLESRINQLEWKLYRARDAILSMATEEVQQILRSYSSCVSRNDANQWNSSVVAKIISLAEERPSQGTSIANCPLCGRGSFSRNQSGFVLPEGLRRHLLGWNHAYQCDVFAAVDALAQDYWHHQFSTAEEAEAEKEQAQRQARTTLRRRLEQLYRVAPDLEPRLIDEGLDHGKIPRNAVSMKWAERRLKLLGFEIVREGTVRSYLSDRGDFAVYADPRTHGSIEFAIFKKPLPKMGRQMRVWAFKRFDLQDSWKNDVRGKYESRLANFMAS